MTELTTERVAGLREWIANASRYNDEIAPPTDAELAAILDIYEANRRRASSDSPDSNRPVCGWYWHPSAGWDVRAVAWHNGEWWEQHLCGLVESPVWWTEFPSWTREDGGDE